MKPTIKTSTVRFTLDDAQAASDEWSFNCGPSALCAILGMTPDEIRPHMHDFERKGYSNPTLVANVLRELEVPFRRVYQCKADVHEAPNDHVFPSFGLVRIQWSGPWTRPKVPVRVRYRQTHWIGLRLDGDCGRNEVFDVNAMCVGGWLPYYEWANQLVPWLIKECVPKGDGNWWPTHCWEIDA